MLKLSELSQRELDIIETMFNGVEGAIIIDEKGIVRVFTDYYARESGLNKVDVLGKKVDLVFPQTRMLEVLHTGKAIIADIWELKGKAQIVSRIPIVAKGKIIGALGFSIFRYMDEAQGFARRVQKMFSELKYYKEEVKRLSGAKYSLDAIIGESEEILEAKERVKMVSSSNIPVHISGATGTGKELLAHAVHQESSRRDGPFVRVNCAGIPENLIESELFGYDEGAFTGARKGGKPGKFELANRGSIFLDEVSELSWAAQAKLLRTIQESEIERVGGTEIIPVDVRIISASNVSLNQLVAEGKFRKDLLFRLNVFNVHIPPLRERPCDIYLLTNHFIENYNLENGRKIEGLSKDAHELLLTYHWPGNVRELNIVIERACIDAREGLLSVDNLLRFAGLARNKYDRDYGYKGFDIKEAKREAEKVTIIRALKAASGNKVKTSELLGISRSSLYQKIEDLGIEI